ncbi:MAG: nucleotidyltransferase family protein [Actinobacteria bacterium]|nr:MAG: nucleotidyltransferase family protein [Actinomycetota bacterium]
MEAVLIAGGRAERLGDAAEGRPKPLVPIAGRPLAAYQVSQLEAVGVMRVIVSCSAGQEDAFREELGGIGPDVVTVGEPEPLGRGGGLRLALQARQESGPLYVLNGDELIDVDLAALLAGHRDHGAAATIVVAPLPTAFGVVDIADDDRVNGFQDSPQLPFWAHAGVNVFDDEALARLPERGDHETTTLPELAAEGKLYAHRHAGLWLTVNTPKDLRAADEHLRANPDWLTEAART